LSLPTQEIRERHPGGVASLGWRTLVVFGLYFGAGKLGLSVPFTSGNVSPVWPASGVALAAVLLWGYQVWPGILLGAFFTNFFSPVPALSCLGIALGNTSSALLGGYWLRRFTGFQASLARMRDVLGLMVIGAAASPIAAASIGVSTLTLMHVHAWSGFAAAWGIWWLGDAMGVLVVAPLFLTIRATGTAAESRKRSEFFLLFLGLSVTCAALFGGHSWFGVRDDVLAFITFPFVIWAAIRFRAAGSAVASAVIAVFAVWGTAVGQGPFLKHNLLVNAELLQLFIAVTSGTGLILAAVISEREHISRAFDREEKLVHELKETQSLLQQEREHLEQKVRYRTSELEQRTSQVIEQARLLDLVNDAIFVRSLDNKIIYWNHGAEQLYGWAKDEVLGSASDEILHTRFPRPFSEIKDQLLRSGSWVGELMHSRRDGSWIHVASRWSLWRDGEGVLRGWLQINTDISERTRAEESLRLLSGRLLQVQDEERRRLARDLHDSAGQLLAVLSMSLAPLEDDGSISAAAAATIRDCLVVVKELSSELRTVCHLLHPPLLDESGLSSGLRLYLDGFTARSTLKVDLELADDFGRLPRELETAIFRIVQECLTNIHKHSGSPVAKVSIMRSDEQIRVAVEDKGKGIPPEKRTTLESGGMVGIGIRGIRERLRQLNGSLEINSNGHGTTIVASLPLMKTSWMTESERELF
jgi:PAS domain S-box-containing protein